MTDERKPQSLDDPQVRATAVRNLLWLTPVAFAGCWLAAWLQGVGAGIPLVIALLGAGMSLGAACVIHLMGSKSRYAMVAVKAALMLFGRR